MSELEDQCHAAPHIQRQYQAISNQLHRNRLSGAVDTLFSLSQVAGKALPKDGLDREAAEKAVMELEQISLQACAPLSLC